MAEGKLSQVTVAETEKRRELVLTGSSINPSLTKYGLDQRLYKLTLLNFLEISDTCLNELSEDIGNLSSLVNLVLRGNNLKFLPKNIGKLSKLHLLDVSRNKLENLPEELFDLTELHTFDFSYNQIDCISDKACNLSHLSVLNASNNKLETLDQICTPELEHLSEINASHNQVNALNHQVNELGALKKLDLSENALTELPVELSSCSKLKELNLKGNPIKDKRLLKLVEQGRGLKPILENIASRGVKQTVEESSSLAKNTTEKKNKNRKKKKGGGKDVALGDEDEDLPKKFIEVLHFQDIRDAVEVIVTRDVLEVRPYIVCCVIQDVDLKRNNLFKKFIKLQTKLHDGPLCAKRTKATIATHDMYAVQSPLLYDARPPQHIQITPLGKSRPTTALKLVTDLRKEAEEMRKEQKRNSFSGIHKYLELLAGHERFPCLDNKDGHVISFPPITNADLTKISPETDAMLIEVTSSKDLSSCKRVMEELIREMHDMEMGRLTPSNSSTGEKKEDDFYSDSGDEDKEEEVKEQDESAPSLPSGSKKLVVRQVKISDEQGKLKVVYPSRTDLDFPGIDIIRDF